MATHTINSNKIVSRIILAAFIITSVQAPNYAQMADDQLLHLPQPGAMVYLSPAFTAAQLQGVTIHPENALQFDFLVHKSDQDLEGDQKKEEYKKLIKYFLASLTIPDKDQWVNLSPYENNRIIKDDFGKTEMGRDLLAEDYMLKQVTSSLIYPENGLGKEFWDRIYERAWKEYRTTDIPVNTFNKVWIVPDQAIVYESGNTAYILQSHLKVMLEEDYLSLERHSAPAANLSSGVHSIGSQVIREIILPELEKEVNEGRNFSTLRQMYSGMVLATWYKKVLRESLLGKVYADKEKVWGVNVRDPKVDEEIYQRYLQAFKKGVFNYIKDDVDKYTNEEIPRKYFSGGFDRAMVGRVDDVKVIHLEDFFRDLTYKNLYRQALENLERSKNTMDTAVVRLNTATRPRGEENPSGVDQAMAILPDDERFEVSFRRHVHGAGLLDIDRPLNSFHTAVTEVIDNPATYAPVDIEKAAAIREAVFGDNGYASILHKGDELARLFIQKGKEISEDDRMDMRMKAMGFWKEALKGLEEQEKILLSLGKPGGRIARNSDFLAMSKNDLQQTIRSLRWGIEFAESKDSSGTTTLNAVLKIIPQTLKSSLVIEGGSYLTTRINGNALSIASVVYNLLDNSYQAAWGADRTPAVKLRLSEENGKLLVEFSDNGPGLPADYLEMDPATGRQKIFNLNNTTRSENGGTGLGTTEAYYVLQGRIKAENLPEGGAKFTMEFPADAAMNAGYYWEKELKQAKQYIESRQWEAAVKELSSAAKEFSKTRLLSRRPLNDLTILFISEYGNFLKNEHGSKDFGFGYGYAYWDSELNKVHDYIVSQQWVLVVQILDRAVREIPKYRVFLRKHLSDLTVSFVNAYAKTLSTDAAMIVSPILRLRGEDSPLNRQSPFERQTGKSVILDFNNDFANQNLDYRERNISRALEAVQGDIGHVILRRTLEGPIAEGREKIRTVEVTKGPVHPTLQAFIKDLAFRAGNMAVNEDADKASLAKNGGIDFNSANFDLQIKRDGLGVPLPLSRQNMAQLNRIQGFEPEIIEIKPVVNLPILSELQQKLQTSST